MQSTNRGRRAALLLAIIATPLIGRAQEPPVADAAAAERPAAALPSGLLDPAVVEAFFDGIIRAHLADHHIAGATVAVVADGRVLLAKGYGFADVETRRRVSPDETLFRIGSISKIFAWTAIMQLVQQGRIGLDDEVNAHLGDGVQVPATYDEPVRIRHLLTHTPGFEDQVIGLFGRDATSLRPLQQVLAEEMPTRVRPPGQVVSYSNHGTGIAGYIVERVVDQSWDEYVESRIIDPLGMTHTTFRQPFPEPLAQVASKGYSWAGRFVEEGFEYVPLAPVGAAGSTAADMARFMLAHLQRGTLDGATILEPDTARQMQSDLFRHAEAAQASAHGFYEMSRNGQRVIGHGGDTLWFHSEMGLLPDRGVGLFVSYNSAGGAGATRDVYATFMDTFFPIDDAAAPPPPGAGAAERAVRVAGHYRSTRYSHDSIAKLSALSTIQVSVADDGALLTSITGDLRWIEVAPLTFRAEHDDRTIVFREEDGRISHLFLGWVPVVAFERVGHAGNPVLHMAIAGLGTLIFAAAAILWPGAAFMRWRHSYELARQRRMPWAARASGWAGSVLFLLFGVGMVGLASDPNQVVYGGGARLAAILSLPLVGIPLALLALYQCFQIWRLRRGDLLPRLGYAVLCVAFVAVYWQLWYWNLLGYRY